MVINIKVPVRILIAQTVHVMLETLAKVFSEFAKVTFFFANVSRKLDIIIIM